MNRRNFHLLTASLFTGIISDRTVYQAEVENDLFDKAKIEMEYTKNFLSDWFAKRIDKPNSIDDFYLNKVMAPDFTIVRPNGERLTRAQTLQGFFNKLYGFEPDNIRHDNTHIQALFSSKDLIMVGYDETHVYRTHEVTNTLTSVLLRDDEAPNGVLWVLVHETPKAL